MGTHCFVLFSSVRMERSHAMLIIVGKFFFASDNIQEDLHFIPCFDIWYILQGNLIMK